MAQGCGNWKAISDLMGTKSTKQVEEHYWELYMGVHGYCLPKTVTWGAKDGTSTDEYCRPSASSASSAPSASSASSASSAGGAKKGDEGEEKGEKEGEKEKGEEGEKEEGETQMDEYDAKDVDDLYRIRVTQGYTRGELVERDKGFGQKNINKQELRDRMANLAGHDLPGFLPLRGDYDYEYENDAERMLSEMEFTHDEHPSEKALKLQIIGIYNHKLKERVRRKDFVQERGLIDLKSQQQLDRRRTKEDRDVVGKLRVFARFHSKEEHEALVEGVLKARRLRQQIELYRTYRHMGIRTMEQARVYENTKRIRERDLKARKHKESAPYLFQTSQSYQSNSQSNASQEDDGKLSGRRRGRDGSLEASGATGARKSTRGSLGGPSAKAEEEATGEGGAMGRGGLGQMVEDPANIAKSPGGEILSDLELHLCASVPMMPLHYLAAKDAIIREAYRNGQLTSEGVHRILKVDADRGEKIFDFFVKEMLNDTPAQSS
jgi:transcriptional adapter 2-alpha